MRQIMIGVQTYLADYNDQWPTSFDIISPEYLGQSALGERSVFINPREGYLTYLLMPLPSPLDQIEDPAGTPVLYEMKIDGTTDPNGCIGYADGHVVGPADRTEEP